MDDNDDLINSFIEEAREHLPVIEASLLTLEHKPDDQTVLNELFRSVHTIKGGAGFFGLHTISTLTHSMESLLSLARTNKIKLTHQHIDVLLTSQDRFVQMIEDPQNSNNINVEHECQQLNHLIEHPEEHTSVSAQAANSHQNSPSNPISDNNQPAEAEQTNKSKQEPSFKKQSSLDEPSSISLENKILEHEEVLQHDLLNSFIEEARECVPRIETALLALEANPGNMQQLNELFRNVHTIKGGASFLGLIKILQVSHIMEDVLALAKAARIVMEGKYIDTLLEGYDCLTQLIEQHQNDAEVEVENLCHRLAELKQIDFCDYQTEVMNRVIAPSESSDTYAVAKSTVKGSSAPFPALTSPKVIIEDEAVVSHTETEETIRVHVKRLNKLIDLAGELVLVRNQVFRLCEPLIVQTPGLKVILHNFNRITTEMQEEIMGTRMQPIGVIFNKFPRLIRQLEKDLGKQLELVTEGADVELDKTIIESLSDPVTHIIRNMADHGIESPQERIKKGKPPCGTILQKAFHESGQVVIQFSDDGKGIDPEFIANKALEKGIITTDMMEKMTAKEKINLIFTPGFSTAKTVSSVSGRGIGMDVVKTNIEQIGGSIDINSHLGKWSSITMTLPLTMAIISALIISVQNCRFAFPQSNLEEMVLLESEEYAQKVGKVRGQRMLFLRGDFLPLISLAESLNRHLS